jgi:hypothetical protein
MNTHMRARTHAHTQPMATMGFTTMSYIGRAVGSTTAQYLNGRIKHLVIWNRALRCVCWCIRACHVWRCGCSIACSICPGAYVWKRLSPSQACTSDVHLHTQANELCSSGQSFAQYDTEGHAVRALTHTYTQYSAAEIASYNSQFFSTSAPSVRPTQVRE